MFSGPALPIRPALRVTKMAVLVDVYVHLSHELRGEIPELRNDRARGIGQCERTLFSSEMKCKDRDKPRGISDVNKTKDRRGLSEV